MNDLPQLLESKKNPFIGEYNKYKELISSNIKWLLIGVAMYSGAKYHNIISRVEDFVLYNKTHVEQGFFEDPHGLEVIIKTNSSGRREVYLSHEESNSYVAISSDFFKKYKTKFNCNQK